MHSDDASYASEIVKNLSTPLTTSFETRTKGVNDLSKLTFRRFDRRRSILFARLQAALLLVARFPSILAIRAADTFENTTNQSGLHAGTACHRALKKPPWYL